MGIEDKYLDVLQNIEAAALHFHRKDPSFRDVEVIKAYELAIRHFQRKVLGKAPDTDLAEEPAINLFKGILEILDQREDLSNSTTDDSEPQRRFSRALKEPTKDEIYLACLRKLHNSAKRWNKRNGATGYLNFVSQFVS